jgi:dienelactone hydrolase
MRPSLLSAFLTIYSKMAGREARPTQSIRMNLMRASLVLVLLGVIGSGLRGQSPALPVQYREPFAASFPIREAQHRQIKAYAEKLPPVQRQPAMPQLAPDYSSVAAYERSVEPVREKLKGFFGVPPGAREGRITKFEQVGEDQHCTVHRVWIEVIDGVEAYGLYLLPKKRAAKAPLLIAQHGGGGNPEAICDLDTRDNYRKFGPEAVKRGYIVWAPALAMRSDYSGDVAIPGANREDLDRLLKRGGTSIIGLEMHKIIESTRTLMKTRPEIDPQRVGMTGLSWGGFYTLYVTAQSPFIKAAAPAASLRDAEEIRARLPAGQARSTDRGVEGLTHAEVVALICPRPCLVQIGETDTVVPIAGGRKESARAAVFYEKLGQAGRYRFQVHAGGHVFDTQAILDFFDREL